MATRTDNSKLKRLREQAERLKAEIQAAEAKARDQERKDRTRRMIILGGLADAVLEEGGDLADQLRSIISPELAKRVRSDQRRYVADLLPAGSADAGTDAGQDHSPRAAQVESVDVEGQQTPAPPVAA